MMAVAKINYRSLRDRVTRRRRGAALANVLAILAIIVVVFLLSTASCGSARETGRQNTCRENLRKLAVAAADYHDLHGRYPGYVNPSDENPFLANDGKTPVGTGPVSWVAALVESLDHPRTVAIGRGTAESTPTASPTSTGTVPRLAPNHGYRETLICPSNEMPRSGPLLSYVANSGMPDAPQAIAPQDGRAGIPRDWPANGVFFDRYSEAPSTVGDSRLRGPTVTMTRALIRDSLDRTILFTENVNAGPYFIDPRELSGGDAVRAEVVWCAVWGAGPIKVGVPPRDPAIMTSAHGPSATPAATGPALVWRGLPSMQPPSDLLAINAGGDHVGPATSYRYSRPSSRHPQGCNFAFAGGNVVFLRDTIDYFVYAKLMASDDANAKLPGTDALLDKHFRTYHLIDEDIVP